MTTKRQILAFINRHPVFFLATSDSGVPHVRALMLYRADKDGIVFNIGKNKALCRQLSANPAVELCFYDPEEMTQVRIEGTVEVLKSMSLKREIVRNNPVLKTWLEKHGYDIFQAYRLRNGKATAWSMKVDAGRKHNYIEF